MKMYELTRLEALFLLERLREVKDCPYDMDHEEIDQAIEILEALMGEEYDIG